MSCRRSIPFLSSLSLSLVTRRRRRRQTGYSTVPSLDEDSSGADNGGRRDENEGGGGGGGRRCFRGTCRGVHNVEVGRRVAKQTYHNPTRRDARRDIILRARARIPVREGGREEGYGTCYVQATGINMYGT